LDIRRHVSEGALFEIGDVAKEHRVLTLHIADPIIGRKLGSKKTCGRKRGSSDDE